MTFSRKIKEEIINENITKVELIALLSGFIRNNGKLNNDKLEVKSEFDFVLDYIKQAIYSNFVLQSRYLNKKNIEVEENNFFISLVNFDNDIENIKELLSDKEQERGYLKGTFLSCGSINDPKTSKTYHFEMGFTSDKEILLIQEILLRYGLNPKILKRNNKYILYIKNSEEISDFLRIINAKNSLLYYENVRIYNEEINKINRINNVEQANTEKALKSALEQIKMIDYIKENNLFKNLDDKIKLTISYRIKYPEDSLEELAIKMRKNGIDITKSGINHHMRKIKEMAKK